MIMTVKGGRRRRTLAREGTMRKLLYLSVGVGIYWRNAGCERDEMGKRENI
jgi:hypothetical protein